MDRLYYIPGVSDKSSSNESYDCRALFAKTGPHRLFLSIESGIKMYSTLFVFFEKFNFAIFLDLPTSDMLSSRFWPKKYP